MIESDAFCLNGMSRVSEGPVPPDDISIATDYSGFANYIGIDKDPDATKFITSYVGKGWLTEPDSSDECAAYAGGQPILWKCGNHAHQVQPTHWRDDDQTLHYIGPEAERHQRHHIAHTQGHFSEHHRCDLWIDGCDPCRAGWM